MPPSPSPTRLQVLSNTTCQTMKCGQFLHFFSNICFCSAGGHRLGEASSVSVSGERKPEAEPEPDAGPPAAAVHYPLPVQHHAHQGETRSGSVGTHRRAMRSRQGDAVTSCVGCHRRTRTCAAECSSWSCRCSSEPSSCRTWNDRVSRLSGGEERS